MPLRNHHVLDPLDTIKLGKHRARRCHLALWHTVTIALLMILVNSGVTPALAAPKERCFSATGYCLSGEIATFWAQNGGLAVFGYPITALQREEIEGTQIDVQWFERHRLELHPELAPPYRVQLGRLGVEHLARQGRGTSQITDATPAPGCRLFPETSHQVCGALLQAWKSAGVERDGRRGTSDPEHLALFGQPLTDEQPEVLRDGHSYIVQWFERARMEIHPDQPERSRILFGLLGTELSPQAVVPPQTSLTHPVRIVFPSLNLDEAISPAGLNSAGMPVVPKHDVGWYSLSAAPGEGENVVLWGHVLRFSDEPQIPAPFAKVKNLHLGAKIIIYNRGGDAVTYLVTQQIWVQPNQVEYILPQGRERLTLISCIGDQVIVDGEVTDMSHRLVTIAVPVNT